MDDKPVLIISDTHAPYHHPHALDFLWDTYNAYGCKRVCHVGDLLDFHYSSYHTSELDAYNPVQEYELAMEFVAQMVELFPKGDLVRGNHGMIPHRKMKDAGIGEYAMKDVNTLYGLPKSWKIHEQYHVIKFKGWDTDVLVEHGMNSNGRNGAIRSAEAKRCSYVQGHSHAFAGVQYSTNFKDTIFGMNVGALADSHSLAQRYGKFFKNKQVSACGIVFSPEHAIVEKMNERIYS